MNTKFDVGQRVTYPVVHTADGNITGIAVSKAGVTSYAIGPKWYTEDDLKPYEEEKAIAEPVNDSSHNPHILSVGDKVVCLGKYHVMDPECYPLKGTIGTVIRENLNIFNQIYEIKWADGSTSMDDTWRAFNDDIEPYTYLTNESKPKPVKLYCVKDFAPGTWLTKGKIYEAESGFCVTYDDGWKSTEGYSSIEEFHSACPETGAPLFPLVRRPAKVGEWVYIENPKAHDPDVLAGSIYKIDGVSISLPFPYLSSRNAFREDEFLVLDGYHGDSE